MRAGLILVNVILGLWLFAALAGHLTGEAKQEEFSVKKGGNKKNVTSVDAPPKAEIAPISLDSRMATIVDNNIFNSERCPNAMFGRGRGGRIELSLVGTFEIGGVKGAIIKQRTGTSQNRMPFGGGMGGMGGMGGNRRWGANNQAANASTPSTMRVELVDGVWRNIASPDANKAQNRTTALQQYVRLGETLSNGYTLTEVSRYGAVLTRGGDTMELALQDPSQGLVKSTSTPRAPSAVQQLQQIQQMQVWQNFQMMRMLQRPNQGGNQGGNSGNRGGGGQPRR
ncbi:MAG: hypothetical protein LBM70_09200 [Victivallales bacterium]|jgi:hypothetical protein|nr:hypothetical protein [Victivallales bacterium]